MKVLGKKGIVTDLRYVILTFFSFLIILGFTALLWQNIYVNGFVKLNTDGLIEDSTLSNIDDLNVVYRFVDKIVPLIFIFLWMLVIFSSITVSPDHPIYFFAGFFSLLFTTFIAFLFVDLGSLIFENSVFVPVLDVLSNTIFFVNNYHFISFGVMLFSLVWWFRRTGVNSSNAGFGGIE